MSKDALQNQAEQAASLSDSKQQFEKLAQTIFRSQQNYRDLIDSLDQALFTLSLQGEIRVANLRMSQILGAPFQEIIGHPLSDFLLSPTPEELLQSMPALLKKGTWTGIVPVTLKKDRELRHFSCWFQTLVERGEVVALTGWARDVTEQFEIEKRLHQEQEFNRRLIANFPDLIAVLDLQARFTYISDQVRNILGRSPQEYLGGEFGVRAGPEDKARIDEMFRRVIKGEVSRSQLEFRAPHADGTWRVLLLTAGPLFDEAGKISGVVTSTRDVTEQHEIERKLHQEQEFVRRLVECFPDLIVVLDSEGRFKFVSERLKDILGVPAEEYVGKQVGLRMGSEDRAKLSEMLQNTISGRKAQEQIEIRAQHVDGTWKSLRITARPLFDERGNITGMVSSGRDVTESKQFEQQLAQSEKFAAMGQMMAGAAHELNNPLTAILGISDLLRERATDETTRRQVDTILKQARRAAGIVLNLLAFSRPSAHGNARIDLKATIQEALQTEAALLAQKNIRVTFEASGEIPPVEGNPRLLMQVFSNLIANAEQSISAVRGEGRLDISVSCVDHRIRVSFADDGGGIAPEIMDKVFDPFFTTKRPGGGSGLGLTIALAVIKEHGGTIEVQSTAGLGATFHVFLTPCTQALSASASPSSPSLASPPPRKDILKGHSVLIVDDEESIREIVAEDLSRRGMKVNAVESSEAALGYLSANECEMVICDFNLPGISGEALFEKILAKENGSRPRFVFMTGELVDPALVSKYREKGARILQKPFSISVLAALLAEFLQGEAVPSV
jgi:PAS domain S-box-containing protein